MSFLGARKIFLIPSFELNVKEEEKILKFLKFLEESNVGNIISRYINNNNNLGGRPNVNYYNLFAVIIYGFAFNRDTLRDLEDACLYDLRYIYIMEQVQPSYTTISNFINKVIVPNEKEIFGLLNIQIAKELSIEFEDGFIDGTKMEANANKYNFVWKPTTFHKKISITFFELLKSNDLCETYRFEEQVKSKTIASAINELSLNKNKYEEKKYANLLKTLSAILSKVLEYEEKEMICGLDRKSYYKTDHDATAMCLKKDFYSGLGSNMHAEYNTQILVIKGLVFSYYVSQSRIDCNDFIPTLDTFYKLYGEYPKNVCADAGYGSIENYKYLNKNNIGNYVKYYSWEGNSSGTNPDCYKLNEDNSITCLNGLTGYECKIENRHPRKSSAIFYKIEGCKNCTYKEYCMKHTKHSNDKDYKIFEVVIDLIKYKQQAEENLLSIKGIEMRVNRSVQVEGVFGIEKQDRKYNRVRRRGLKNVSTELMLVLVGINIKKLFRFYDDGYFPKYWIAPKDLEPQQFKKPSAKRLSKKGRKINDKLFNK